MSSCNKLLFVNSDVFPFKGSITALANCLDSDLEIGVVQGLLIYPQSKLTQSTGHTFGPYFNSHALEGRNIDDELVNKSQQRQGLTSAFYMTYRKIFDRMDGFDEKYFNAWEGLDFSLKVSCSGMKCLYYPESKAYHIRGGSRGYLPNNESQQSAYFWSRWGSKLKYDLFQLINLQIGLATRVRNYLLINCTYLLSISEFLKNIDISISEQINVRERFESKNLDLYLNLSHEIHSFNGDLLFVISDFRMLTLNKKWIESRQKKNDLVIDLKGNVMKLKNILNYG